MKIRHVLNICLLLVHAQTGFAQDTAILLTRDMVLKDEKLIPLQFLQGWIFRKGNDPRWAEKEIDVSGWERKNPPQLSKRLADENGKLECWLRIKIKFDTAFEKTPFYFFIHGWAATDVYVDGTLFNTLLSVVNWPLPSFPEPFQTAVALRIIVLKLVVGQS